MKIKIPWQKIQLIRAMKDFNDLSLWVDCSGVDLFVFELPDKELVSAIVMGSGDIECGITIFFENDIFEQVFRAINASKDTRNMKFVGISLNEYQEMSPLEKKWIKSCNYRAKKREVLPLALQCDSRGVKYLEDNKLMTKALFVVKGLVKAYREEIVTHTTFNKTFTKIITLKLSGTPREPQVQADFVHYPQSKQLLEHIKVVKKSFWNIDLLDKAKKTESEYILVGFYKGENEQEDSICTFCVIDASDSKYLYKEDITMDSRCVAESLREVFFEHGLPKKVSVTSLQLFRELEEYFNLQGIEVDCNTEHPALEMVAKDLDFDSDQLPDPLEMLEALQQKPEDDDLDEWFYLKMYSFSIITLLSISKGNRLFESGTAKYVNDIDRKSLTEDPISIEFMKSLVVYFIFSALKEDSSGSGIKSLSEKSAGLYLFLQCFRNSKLSIYKILNISSQDTEKIRLKDVFTEQIVCIDYASGHNEAAEGDYIAAIVYNLGNFTFSDAISPIFNQPQIDEAIKELESMGMPSKNQSSWLEENAYIFGKFWKRYIKQ